MPCSRVFASTEVLLQQVIYEIAANAVDFMRSKLSESFVNRHGPESRSNSLARADGFVAARPTQITLRFKVLPNHAPGSFFAQWTRHLVFARIVQIYRTVSPSMGGFPRRLSNSEDRRY